MFSDLRHHPRYSIHLELTDPVPKFIPRQWRGYAEQDREALIRYTVPSKMVLTAYTIYQCQSETNVQNAGPCRLSTIGKLV